jgi:hypothetical protein
LRCGRCRRLRSLASARIRGPTNVPVPQAWLEFDVGSVEKATAELESKGYKMLVKNKKEPWGQVVSRFLSPEGLLVGVTFTPMMRDSKEEAS